MEKYVLSYNDKEDILYLKILGVMTGEDLQELMPRIQKMFEGKTHRVTLINMSQTAQIGP